ncbi:MAG: hypothetical protein RLZZ533_506 [Cyanobacteriota bacterium]
MGVEPQRTGAGLSHQVQHVEAGGMTTPTFTEPLSIGELEASYPLYCKALRILVRDGVSLSKASRTVAWSRLSTLHHCMPRQYRHPEQLFFLLNRDVQNQGATAH